MGSSPIRHPLHIFSRRQPASARPRGSMDRASDFGSEGWGFESLRGHLVQLMRARATHKAQAGLRKRLRREAALLDAAIVLRHSHQVHTAHQ